VKLIDLESSVHFYYLVFALMLGVFFLLRAVLASPFGHALSGLRVNEQRMRSLGFRPFSYKLAAFVLAGTLAGLAGYFSACQFGFVNPEILSWHYSGSVLMMLILGGMGRLYGAIVGAFAFALLQEILASESLFGPLAKHWQLPMGVFIVLVVLLAPRGLTGFLAPPSPRWRPEVDA
jgi:branched-chain amino acid transport system permease protein